MSQSPPESSEAHQEISSAILEVALSFDNPQTQLGFLQRTFAQDPEGMEEMQRLIDAARSATSFFLVARERREHLASDLLAEMTPAQAEGAELADSPLEASGMVLGNYRLIQRIGEGGGGVVYEADQELPIRRRVAVKIVRLGMNTESVIARFGIERQALAMMDHPHIAKVLDAGSTASGRPYFVMELVIGEKITSYCDRHRLGLAERLKLFIQVCHAIQHAHQKGIIHRDIKPSNVLVTTQDGVASPKVIDFGIAKAIESQSLDQTSFTAHDQFFGTPAYMSPEQIDLAGLDVDTRSDIYSLGVLLHELLTSRTPLDVADLARSGLSAIREAVLTAETPRPSQVLADLPAETRAELARQRRCEPSQLLGSIRGDLDWIALKAMEKSRARRYQTANSLALDVQRYLDHEPVIARPPSAFYLFAKFIRRNRLAFAAGATLTLLLIVGFVVTLTLYNRERAALAEQSRLREEAQAARNEESRLLRQAEARANVARVAFLLDQGRVAEADELRQRYPLSSIEPSLEAAAVFRALGDWNAKHGRWDQAIQCFRLLIEVNRLDVPTKILDGSDLIAAAVALQRERASEYRAFRDEVLDHYLPVVSPLSAEHLLKICLLAPADPLTLARLAPGAELLTDPFKSPHPAWAGLSLSLYHLRRGDPGAALAAGDLGLSDPSIKNSCRAAIGCMRALAYLRLENREAARRELNAAQKLTDESDGSEFIMGKPITPFWFDWSLVTILMQEAAQQGLHSDSGP